MIKFEFNYDGSTLVNEKGYATLVEVAKDICNKAGVELGSTSFLNSNKQIAVYDNTVTAREYIGYIAESAGCFACIGRDGKLYFRAIGEDETKISLDMFGEYKWGEEFKISKVSYEDGTRSFKFGDDTRNNLWIDQDNMFIVDEEQVQNIYNKIKGLTINSFEGKTVIDPRIDIGDKIIIDGKTVIYQGEMTLEGRFIAQISSKIQIKQKEETTVKKESQTVINRRVQSEINQIDGKITQLVEETSENTEKLSQHEQTIDSITNTVSSVETKVETAQSTADKAQTSANNAQTTANTANTNAQNAQSTADGAVTQIQTTITKLTEVEQTVDGISQSVSAVEEKVETVESTANTAKNTADNIGTNLTTNYFTKTEMENKLTQTAESTISEVSKTYSTKTETANAKTEAINSANASTDEKLEDYTVTSKLGTFIEQNWEYIKYAWNQISQYLKMEGIDGKATLNIYDENNKMLMSLSQDGQAFYDSLGNKIGTVGIVREDNKDTLAFAMNVDWNVVSESKSMAWGYFDKNGKFLPIFHLVGTYGTDDSEYGGELAVEGSLTVSETLKIDKNTIQSGEPNFNIIDQDGYTLLNIESGVIHTPQGLYVPLSDTTGHYGFPMIGINQANKYFCVWAYDALNFYVNNTYVGNVYTNSTSDKRLKSNFAEIEEKILKVINELKIQQFNIQNRQKINFGIIAQDLIEKCNKENIDINEYEILGKFKRNLNEDTEYFKIDYTQFLILKQLATDKKIEKLNETIENLTKRLETLEKEVNK